MVGVLQGAHGSNIMTANSLKKTMAFRWGLLDISRNLRLINDL